MPRPPDVKVFRRATEKTIREGWSVPPGGAKGDGAPGSWGLHAVPVVAYDEHGLIVVTWGELQRMTWGFWQTYCDEAYAVLSPDWIGKRKTAPSGIDWEGLREGFETRGGTGLSSVA